MCDMCKENNDEMTGCQDCGTPICFDDGTAYVTASGDVFCRRCGQSMDEAETEDDDLGWDYYPSDWYDASSPLSKLEPEETPRYKYIGEGSQQYELTAPEYDLLESMRNIYLHDWRENDDNEVTAGWRETNYYTFHQLGWVRLISLGLIETRGNEFRISDEGSKVIAELEKKLTTPGA